MLSIIIFIFLIHRFENPLLLNLWDVEHVEIDEFESSKSRLGYTVD